jgi:hypothetical protein
MSAPLTKEQFVERFRSEVERVKASGGYDNEQEHVFADEMLLSALHAAGWGEVAEEWVKWSAEVGFWYA